MKKENIFWIVVLILVDTLLIPIMAYRDAVGLFALWTIIPFEVLHTIPFYFIIKNAQ